MIHANMQCTIKVKTYFITNYNADTNSVLTYGIKMSVTASHLFLTDHQCHPMYIPCKILLKLVKHRNAAFSISHTSYVKKSYLLSMRKYTDWVT